MKKTAIIALLIISVLLTMVPIAHAANEPVFEVESKTAKPGETVEICISVENNPGILGATLTLTYGENLTLLSAVAGDAFAPLTYTPPGKLTSGKNYVWFGQDLEDADIKDGTILCLTFEVSKQATQGTELPIILSYKNEDIFDGTLQPVTCEIQNGKIEIESALTVDAEALLTRDSLLVSVETAEPIAAVQIFFAEYDQNSILRTCHMKQKNLQVGTTTITFEPPAASMEHCRVFVLKDLAPLCPALVPVPAYTVTFVDYDGSVLSVQSVPAGGNAVPPADPSRSGFTFAGWSGSYTNVAVDSTVTAQYSESTTPAIAVESVTVHAGDTNVTVKIRVRNNPGILGMTLTANYDAQKLQLQSGVNGTALSKLNMTPPGRYKDGCKFTWYAEQLKPTDVADGEILVLSFDIPPETPAGIYPITVSYVEGDIFDLNLQYPAIAIENGSIRVS